MKCGCGWAEQGFSSALIISIFFVEALAAVGELVSRQRLKPGQGLNWSYSAKALLHL
jgi:hypothetical protein